MNNTDTVAQAEQWRADATRYKLLLRLVPAINHKLAGSLQPVSMLAALMARHLSRAQPDMSILSQNAADIQRTCKAAAVARADVLGWIQAPGSRPVTMAAGVAQCIGMLSAEFAIRGCTIDNQTGAAHAEVDLGAVTTLLASTLLTLLDGMTSPLAIRLQENAAIDREAGIVVSWTEMAQTEPLATGSNRHAIGWDDVQAIAAQEGVAMQHRHGRAELLFPALA